MRARHVFKNFAGTTGVIRVPTFFLFRVVVLFVYLLLACFGITPVEASSTTQESCPPLSALKEQSQARVLSLIKLKDNLLSLRDGRSIKLPPSVLFVVNLGDSSAVSKRIEELNAENAVAEENGFTEMENFKCVESHAEAKSIFLQVFTLEGEIRNLRLDFLNLSEDRRKALLLAQEQASLNEESLKEIQQQKNEAEKKAELADRAVKEAETQAQQAEDSKLRKLASEKAILEKYRKDIADLSLKWTSRLETIAASSKKTSEQLSKDAAVLSKTLVGKAEIRSAYFEVVNLWRSLTDEVLASFIEFKSNQQIPEPPEVDQNLVADLKNTPELKEYQDTLKKSNLERSELVNLRERLEKEETGSQFRLLLIAGRLRAQLLQELSKRKDSNAFVLNDVYIDDLVREFRLIPYRPLVVIKSQVLEARELVSSGVAGILTLLHRLLLLIAFILTPILSYRLLHKGSERLDQVRAWLINSRHQIASGPFWALWIKRLNPLLPWIMLFAATRLAAAVVSGTDLEGISEILPYFEYFFAYRIFRILVETSVHTFTRYLPNAHRVDLVITKRITKTAKFLGIFFLASAYMLHATQSVARTGYIYHLIWDAILWFSPILFFIAAYWWREELGRAAIELLPKKMGSLLQKWCLSKKSAIFAAFPTAFILFLFYDAQVSYRVLSQFDYAKKISAQIFRRKLESAAKNQNQLDGQVAAKVPIDAEYLSYFDLGVPSDLSLLISADVLPVNEAVTTIKKWSEAIEEEHTIAIQGVKGIGKSSFLTQLNSELSKFNVDVKRFSLPNKIVNRDGFLKHFGEIFDADLSSGEDAILKLDARIPKTVLLIDEGQNLFLAQRGGFEAFKFFVSLLSAGTKNIFWCVAFNRYSWAYLNAVIGGSEYFRKIYTIDSWSDADIQALILKRHEKSKFSLDFDPIIFATQSSHDTNGAKYVQDRFFQLLWEQSKGNPRTAIVLWLSSLKTVGERRLLVGLPAASPPRPLACLTDEELFVIAAIVRHENLTALEAKSVTSLPDNIVRHSLRVGLERGFLERARDFRYRVKPTWQGPLTQQLINKNFVYE